MIVQYRFDVKANTVPDASLAYPLYGWLMENAPYDFAEAVHEQGETPVSQYLQFCGEETYIWVVSLLGDSAAEALSPVLDGLQTIKLHSSTLSLSLQEKTVIESASSFIRQVRSQPGNSRMNVTFHTPTSFKQNGRHVLFPQ